MSHAFFNPITANPSKGRIETLDSTVAENQR